ncbi:class I SAM-dependent methyltransferase [Streptomyces sp. NPDC054796]
MDTTDLTGYWDRYAANVPEQSDAQALKTAFGWTQYEGHGPGDELLGEPATALELGSGRGNEVAALATKGIATTGIDLSPHFCEQARTRWAHLPAATFLHADALDFLGKAREQWDAIYSIFGACWFTDPERLLPLIRDRLTPGGRLVFSHAPAVPGAYGIQGMYANGFTGRRNHVHRWAYEPDEWAAQLHRHGYTDINVRLLDALDPRDVGTLLAQARRPYTPMCVR